MSTYKEDFLMYTISATEQQLNSMSSKITRNFYAAAKLYTMGKSSLSTNSVPFYEWVNSDFSNSDLLLQENIESSIKVHYIQTENKGRMPTFQAS
jgi:hypothetical protein